MAIPDFQTVMLPLLRIVADRNEHSVSEIVKAIADDFALTEDERKKMLKRGVSTVIRNRVGWATTHLKKAGLIEQRKRAVYGITDEGRKVVEQNPEKLDMDFLKRYPSYIQFRTKSKREPQDEVGEVEVGEPDSIDKSEQTPEETLDDAYEALKSTLADDLLEQVKSCSSEFFEQLVVELLVAMGYGGSIEEAGRAIGKAHDGGIDGIINEDKLGVDIVVIQAKRYRDSTVGRPVIQAFNGAMDPHRARKGVFLTTSTFSKEAKNYVKHAERKIVLIVGTTLANLMIEHDVGVSSYRSFVLKRIDSDYFEE